MKSKFRFTVVTAVLLLSAMIPALDSLSSEFQPIEAEKEFIDTSLDEWLDTFELNSNTSEYPCWTIMIYLSADNNLEKFAVKDMKELIEGSKSLPDCVSILVQIDRHPSNNASAGYSGEALPGEASEYQGVARYEIKNGTLTRLQTLGELDMSQTANLQNFTQWAVEKCPSPKTALIIWNHGSGHLGVGNDESSNNRKMSIGGIRRALETTQNNTGNTLDLLGFDTCYMGTSEVFTEFSGVAKVLVGSQDTEPGDGWDYKRILEYLADNPHTVDEERLGKIIVQTYESWYKSSSSNDTTLAAYDLEDAPKFASAMKTLTDCILKALNNESTAFEVTRAMEWARNQTKAFGKWRIDLYDFLGKLQQATSNVDIRDKAQTVRGIIERMRIAQHVGVGAGDAFGISIFFIPNNSITYTYVGSAAQKFNDSTSWQQVIETYTGIFRNNTYQTYVDSNPVNASTREEVIGSIIGPVTPGESILDYLEAGQTTIIPKIEEPSFEAYDFLDFWIQQPGSRLPPWLVYSSPIDSVNGLTIPIPDMPFGWYDVFATPRIDGQLITGIHGPDTLFGDPLWIPGDGPVIVPTINPPEPIFPGDTPSLPVEIFNLGSAPLPDDPIIVDIFGPDGQLIQSHNVGPNTLLPGDSSILNLPFSPTSPGEYSCTVTQGNSPVFQGDFLTGSDAFGPCDFEVQSHFGFEVDVVLGSEPGATYFEGTQFGESFNLYLTTPQYNPNLEFTLWYQIASGPYNINPYLYVNQSYVINNETDGFASGNGYTYNVSLPNWGYDNYGYPFYAGYEYFVRVLTSLTSGNILPTSYHSFYPPLSEYAPLVTIESLNIIRAPCGENWTFIGTLMNHRDIDANVTYFYYDLYSFIDDSIFYDYASQHFIVPANTTITVERQIPFSCESYPPEGYFDSYFSIGYESVNQDYQEDGERCILVRSVYFPPNDQTFPEILILNETPGLSLVQSNQLSIEVSDDHLFTYSIFLDDMFVTTDYIPGSGTTRQFDVDLALPDGAYNVKIMVSDEAYNRQIVNVNLIVSGGIVTTTSTLPSSSTSNPPSSSPPGTSSSSTGGQQTSSSETPDDTSSGEFSDTLPSNSSDDASGSFLPINYLGIVSAIVIIGLIVRFKRWI